MEYLKAEVEIIVLENVDIVTISTCTDAEWSSGYTDYTNECIVNQKQGWLRNCGDSTLPSYGAWERGKGWDKK